jgi:hypothetical protein
VSVRSTAHAAGRAVARAHRSCCGPWSVAPDYTSAGKAFRRALARPPRPSSNARRPASRRSTKEMRAHSATSDLLPTIGKTPVASSRSNERVMVLPGPKSVRFRQKAEPVVCDSIDAAHRAECGSTVAVAKPGCANTRTAQRRQRTPSGSLHRRWSGLVLAIFLAAATGPSRSSMVRGFYRGSRMTTGFTSRRG